MSAAVSSILIALKTTGVAWVIQSGSATAGSTFLDFTFPSPNLAGNCIVVCAGQYDGGGPPTPSIADDNGNVYSLIETVLGDSGKGKLCLWVALNIAPGANTIHLTGGGDDIDLAAVEYSGILSSAAVDAVVSAGDNADTVTLPDLTTTVPGDVLVMGSYDSENIGEIFAITPSTGWGLRAHSDNPDYECLSLQDHWAGLTGTYSYSVAVTPIAGTASVVCSITILPSLPLVVECDDPPLATVGVPYLHVFPVSGAVLPYNVAVTVGNIPPGLFLNQATGQLQGVPVLAATVHFTIQATDANGAQASADCTITVRPASISLGGLRIWLYGVKRRKKTPPAELCGCPEPSHVKKAV